MLGEGEVAGDAQVAQTERGGGDEALVQLGQHHVQVAKGDRYSCRSGRRPHAPSQGGGVKPDGGREILAADRADAAADAAVQLGPVRVAAQPYGGCGDTNQKVSPRVKREVGVGAGVEQGFDAMDFLGSSLFPVGRGA